MWNLKADDELWWYLDRGHPDPRAVCYDPDTVES